MNMDTQAVPKVTAPGVPTCGLPDPSPHLGLPAHSHLLPVEDVAQVMGLSIATVRYRTRTGSFPQPIQLMPRTIRWHCREATAYRDSQAAYRDSQG